MQFASISSNPDHVLRHYFKDKNPTGHSLRPVVITFLVKTLAILYPGYFMQFYFSAISGIRTHDPPVESHRLNQCATTSHVTKSPCILWAYIIHSFIHFGHFYSAPSSPLLLRGAPDYSTDTVSEFHVEAHRQLQIKALPKVPTWRLERESNPRPSG